MKLLILGIDAMEPDILFGNLDQFPNIRKMCLTGSYGDYDAYAYGYGSRDNWISLYTGLTPRQHGTVGNIYKNTNRKPRREDYSNLEPFWDRLNENGISVGMWNGLVTTPPKKINGYMISGEPNFELDYKDDPLASVKPVFCEEDKVLEKYILGDIDRPPMPRTAEDLGYSWEELLSNPQLVEAILDDKYFIECVDYLEQELEFYKNNLINMQKNNPVDVIFFYTAIVDFLAHFQMHDPSREVMVKAYRLVDRFVGEILSELNPDNIIVMSDHGLKALADFFPDTPVEVQKEAFGWRNNSVWLSNGQLVTKARNRGFMSGIHALKGSFIISGEKIKKKKISEMRTVDFYPTLLELFDIKVQGDRKGYVLDIFSGKEIINMDRLLSKDKITGRDLAIIQNMEVPEFNRIINEVFLDNRFANITVIGEKKYKNIFLGNPRVKSFQEIGDFQLQYMDLGRYDSIFTGYRNQMTGELKYIEIVKGGGSYE